MEGHGQGTEMVCVAEADGVNEENLQCESESRAGHSSALPPRGLNQDLTSLGLSFISGENDGVERSDVEDPTDTCRYERSGVARSSVESWTASSTLLVGCWRKVHKKEDVTAGRRKRLKICPGHFPQLPTLSIPSAPLLKGLLGSSSQRKAAFFNDGPL